MRFRFFSPGHADKDEEEPQTGLAAETVQEAPKAEPEGSETPPEAVGKEGGESPPTQPDLQGEPTEGEAQEAPQQSAIPDEQTEGEAKEAQQENEPLEQPVAQPPAQAEEPKPEKKRGFFSRSKKKVEEKPITKNSITLVLPSLPFGRKKKTYADAPATELVRLEGHKVLVPTYEDIENFGSIYYPVNEPYQFVNLRMENGELIYTNLEPVLTDREKDILKRTEDAYDMLVNVSGVLTNTEDKAQFLDQTFQDIIKIYNLKMTELEYRRILYYVNRDYVGFGKIDTLVRDRLIEDISCNGPDSYVYVYHRFFESVRTNVTFEEVDLNNFILRLAQFSGRHISILQPVRDAALPDGSRINMTLGKEVTKKGSTFTIRKFRSDPISPVEIMMLHTADSKIIAYLWILIEFGRSLLISGGTAAGKSIPYDEKVLVYRSGRPCLVGIGNLYDEIARSKSAKTVRSGDHAYEILECEGIETAAFSPELKVDRFAVRSIVRHPADRPVYEVKTRSGRVVRTTGDHSLFTIAGGSVVPYPVSQLEPGMYTAIPRTIPGPDENTVKSLNLLELFSDEDYGSYVENVVRYAELASGMIGEKEAARLLGIRVQEIHAASKRNYLAVRVCRFAKLLQRTGLEANLDELRIRPKTSRKHGLPANLPITRSLLRFMGYWTAEGAYQGGLAVYQVEEATRSDVVLSGQEAFGLPAYRNPGDAMRIDFKCTTLVALFKSLFGPGEGAAAKTVPDIVLEQGNDLLAEFLRGYFTGDASAGRELEASTKSPMLAERLLYALGRFGIVANVRPKVVKGRTYHRVLIYGQRNLQIFEQRIGFLNKRNQASLATYVHRTIFPHTNVETIPGVSSLMKEALLFKSGEAKKQLWSDLHSYWAPEAAKNVGRQTLLSFLEQTGAEAGARERPLRLAYSDIFWDEVEQVEQVEYGRDYVYDLEVPGAENFVGGGGGVFLHNTTLLNAISMLIRPENKIVSVEDTPEINLAHKNWIEAVTRIGYGETAGGALSGISGVSGIGLSAKSAGDISLFDLLIAALRQRPDFIIVGEVRGEEAYTLFQAISVGHATMGTIHAASMPELLARTESQPMNVPRVMIANLDLVIFLAAVRKGDEKVRRIRDVVEILGINPSTKELITNVVFRWDPVHDSFEFTGRSFQIEKISKTTGVPIETLDKELDNRIKLLDRMMAEGVTNYKAVTEIVRQYYLDREALLRKEAFASMVPVNTEQNISWGGRSAGKS